MDWTGHIYNPIVSKNNFFFVLLTVVYKPLNLTVMFNFQIPNLILKFYFQINYFILRDKKTKDKKPNLA